MKKYMWRRLGFINAIYKRLIKETSKLKNPFLAIGLDGGCNVLVTQMNLHII